MYILLHSTILLALTDGIVKINTVHKTDTIQQSLHSTSKNNNKATLQLSCKHPNFTHTATVPTLSPESLIKLYHFHYRIKPSQGGIIKRFMNGRE